MNCLNISLLMNGIGFCWSKAINVSLSYLFWVFLHTLYLSLKHDEFIMDIAPRPPAPISSHFLKHMLRNSHSHSYQTETCKMYLHHLSLDRTSTVPLNKKIQWKEGILILKCPKNHYNYIFLDQIWSLALNYH